MVVNIKSIIFFSPPKSREKIFSLISLPKDGSENKKYFLFYLHPKVVKNKFFLFSLAKDGSENKKFFFFAPKTSRENEVFINFPPLKTVVKIEVFSRK